MRDYHTYNQWAGAITNRSEEFKKLFGNDAPTGSEHSYKALKLELKEMPEDEIATLPKDLQHWIHAVKSQHRKTKKKTYAEIEHELTTLRSKMATLRELQDADQGFSVTLKIERDTAEGKWKCVAPALNIHTFGETRQEAYDKMSEIVNEYLDDLMSDSPDDS